VHITDWANARDVAIWNGRFGFDEYVEHLIKFLEVMGPGSHVVAVCQPCVQALAAAAIMAEDDNPAQPASLTLMAGPIDTRVNPTKVNELATGRPIQWFEQNLITRVPLRYPGATRRVYPGFLQLTSFISMNLDRHVNAHVRQFEYLVKGDDEQADGHRAFYDEYLAVMDLTAEYYLQTIQVVFKEHLLPRGTWVSRGRKIDPSFIETALMTVEGELDDISGIGQTKAAHALTPNIPGARHVHWEQPRVGHYGIFNGRKWREQILPRVRDFIRANAA
jgi:poly(3-hydroxybutyrate) depolymerase